MDKLRMFQKILMNSTEKTKKKNNLSIEVELGIVKTDYSQFCVCKLLSESLLNRLFLDVLLCLFV